MSYHRKYRPQKLSDYVGNERVKKAVLSSTQTSKKPQVMLLTGESGVGKTTMTRLIAKEYMCEAHGTPEELRLSITQKVSLFPA